MVEPSQPPPLFIVGCPRSGTTMLAELLASTPWGQAEESHFIPKFFDRLGDYQPLDDVGQRLRLVRDIFAERPVQSWFLEVDLPAMAADLPPDFASIVDHVCGLRTAKEGLKTWSDKTPDYVFHLETLHTLFPQAKFIHLVRDGRDVAVSLMAKSWGPANVYTSALYWSRCNTPSAIRETLLESHQYLELHYEDLLRDPEAVLTQVYLFLGLALDSTAIQSAARTVDQDNTGKWRQRLRAREIEVFERTAADTMAAYGYTTSHRQAPIGLLTKLRFKCHQTLAQLWHLFHINIVEGFKIRFLGKDPFGD